MKSFLSKKAVDHEIVVDDETIAVRFYPIKVKTLVNIREMAQGISMALGVLFNRNPFEDFERQTQKFDGGNGDPGGTIEISRPPEESVLKFRAKEREKAITDVTNVLLHENNMKDIARVILDSMREDGEEMFGNDPETFLEQVDLETIPQFLSGLAKANKKVLGPFAETLEKKSLFRVVTDEEPETDETPEQPEG